MSTGIRSLMALVAVGVAGLVAMTVWPVAGERASAPKEPAVIGTRAPQPGVLPAEPAVVTTSSATTSTAAVSASGAAPSTGAAVAEPGQVDATPVIAAELNANQRSVVEAVRTGNHPERLTLAVDPAPFDPAAYARDVQAYLAVTEPARVYQTAPAGPDAVPLRAVVDHTIRLPAGGSTHLTVIGKPFAPVSWSVLDGGTLSNGLASITVQADAAGTATTTYTATPGTVDEVQILVGSPMTVGTLTLTVAVDDPAAAVSTR